MKKGLLLFVLMIGLAGNVAAQTRVLNPTLQKSTAQKPIMEKSALQKPLSVQASITLRFPNGGERMGPGSRQVIRWKVVGPLPSLRIELLRNGSRVQTLTETYPATKGQFVWQVGRIQPGSGYSIRIVAAGGLTSTSKPFSIIPSASTGLLQDAPSPVKGSSGSETKIAKPWFKADQRVEEASPPLVPSTGRHSFFEDQDSPLQTRSPAVPDGGEQDASYQGRLEKDQPETKLPEQPGAWYKEFAETPARQENLPTAGMETELATFPDFEVRAITFDPETRRLNIQIANCGEKDHLDAPLELSLQLDDFGPNVSRKDHITLRTNEEKPWSITLDRSWNWPIDKGRLRCDVTVDPNDTILESNEDNNRHALWLYKSSGPDVNLAADHILIGNNDIVFTPGLWIELGRSDACDHHEDTHSIAFEFKVPLVNYGDQAATGDLRVTTNGDYAGINSTVRHVSLQKGEMRWFTIRRWMGVISSGQSPLKVTWGDDKKMLIEGDIAHKKTELAEWVGCYPELWLWIDRKGPEGTRYNVDETIPVEITVTNSGGSFQEGTICEVEMVKCASSSNQETVAQTRHWSLGSFDRDEKKIIYDFFAPRETGFYIIRATIDYDHRIREYDERNNQRTTRDFCVHP